MKLESSCAAGWLARTRTRPLSTMGMPDIPIWTVAGMIAIGGLMNIIDPLAWLTQTLKRIANGWPSSEIVELRRLNGFSLPLTVSRGIVGDQVVPSIASRTISESSSGV